MASERKTLIIFDTNTVRSTIESEVTYCSFEFGAAYSQVESFIRENGLDDFVKIAVPRIVIEEIKKQKTNRYTSDIDTLSQVYSRLSPMPHVDKTSLQLPKADFDCSAHVEQLAEKYLTEKKVQIIELPKADGRLVDLFRGIVTRAVNMKPPFRHSNKYSDIGFKDVLIWESVLNSEHINDFDKVIFMTADTGLGNDECRKEFEDRTEKYISFQRSADFVVEELSSDYEEYITNHQFVAFAKSDYFKSYLTDQLLEMKFALINAQKCPISRFEILNNCENIEIDQEYSEQENEYVGRVIVSKIKLVLLKEGSEAELIVYSRTFVDEDRNINSTEFVQELTGV